MQHFVGIYSFFLKIIFTFFSFFTLPFPFSLQAFGLSFLMISSDLII